MNKLKSTTKRVLSWTGLTVIISIMAVIIWAQTKGIQPKTPVCSSLGYAQRATQPKYCK